MSNIGKCYRVLTNDEETVAQWPEFVAGFEFQVLRVDKNNEEGITRLVCLKTGKVFDINYYLEGVDTENESSWFWCLFNTSERAEAEIEEIGVLPIPKEASTSPGKIVLNHFRGKEVSIAHALIAFASQENCDGEEYDTMMAAASYIQKLEAKSPMAFAEAVIEGKLDDWATDSFNDSSRDETRNTGYLIRSGVEQFLKI